jgi:hypothetical protein
MAAVERFKAIIVRVKNFILKYHLHQPLKRLKEMIIINSFTKRFKVNKEDLSYYCQSILMIIVKTAVFIILIVKIYPLYKIAGDYIKIGFNFFKIEEIYKFKMPDIKFFYLVSRILIIGLIAYHGFYFLKKQAEGIFSSIIIDNKNNKIYLIKSCLIKNDLYIFSKSDVSPVLIRQNIISKIFNIGTIILQKKDDEKISISSISDIKKASYELS